MDRQEIELLNEIENNECPKLQGTKIYSNEFYERAFNYYYERKVLLKKSYKRPYKLLKRSFDLVCSSFALILLLVPFAVISIAIKIESKGSVIFKQYRIGKNGKQFMCYKFRSMSQNAPHELSTWDFHDSKNYITKVGKFLRKTSLDELPQLFNVLKGNMSLIGYRPILVAEEDCNRIREHIGVLLLKPGITGFAQVMGRDEVYYKNKAILDAYYLNNFGIKIDCKILFKSIKVVFMKTGNQDS